MLEYFDKRHGRLSIDDLMAMLLKLWGLTRDFLPPESVLDPANCRPPGGTENS